MEDVRHELHILVSMAKIDTELSQKRAELQAIPDERRKSERLLADIESGERERNERFDAMKKERRTIETRLEDSAELIKTKKTQLMGIKSNKEYSALLKEIAGVEQGIDGMEERLLRLMDEIDEQKQQMSENAEKTAAERTSLNDSLRALKEREAVLQEEIDGLEAQKPALLKELDPQLKKRYDRLLAKLGDFAVTNVVDEICQGCFSHMPAQKANEVKMNDRIITCVSCGRILVHYE